MLQPRDTDVDFSGMPECSSKICIPYVSSSLLSPLSPSPFKLGRDELINLNRTLGSSLGCGSGVTLSCFCGKPNPLACAWV